MSKLDNLRWYIGKIVLDLAKHHWNMVLSKAQYVYSGNGEVCLTNRSGGFVDDSGLELQIATGRKLNVWAGNLVHEYQHFKQWEEYTPNQRFKNAQEYDPSIEMLEAWTNKSLFSKSALWTSAHRVVKWESDAELRAIRDIKKYDLPLDMSLYIKQATAYMLSYGFVVEARRWPNPRVSDIPELYEEIPNTLDILIDLNAHRGVKKHYAKYRKLFFEYACRPWNAEEDK